MANKLFVDKYKPVQLSDIFGNRTQIQQIKNWISKFNDGKKMIGQSKKRRKINIAMFEDNEENHSEENNNDSSEIVYDPNMSEQIKKKNNKNQIDTQHSCLLITGKHGTGKSCTVSCVLQNMNYKVQNINVSKKCAIKMKSSKSNKANKINKSTSKTGGKINKNLEKLIDDVINGINICDNLNNEYQEKKVMVIDNIESINSQIEKNFILALLKKNELCWHVPIIFISNGKHSKLLTIMKKNSNIVYFQEPSVDNLTKLLIKVYTNEDMFFEDKEVATKIINKSQRDYRRLLQITEDLKISHGDIKITNKIIDEYLDLCKMKDLDLDIYRVASNMILNYTNILDCLKQYESEKVIIPLMLHQNYIKCISKFGNHKQTKNKYDLINSIATSMAVGDVLEDYIYSDQNWDMQEVHGFLTCVYPSYKLTNEKLNAHSEFLPKMLAFPSDFNRTSIKYINKKNVTNSNICLKNMEIHDFIIANKLVKNLIKDGQINECARLFKPYNAKTENIESMLKINKINENKHTLPAAIKKKLISLL